jgi:hypothetical protein
MLRNGERRAENEVCVAMLGVSRFAQKLLGHRVPKSSVERNSGSLSVESSAGVDERTIALGQIWAQVSSHINALDPEDWNLWHWLQDLYFDAGQLFAITISAGRLYRWPVAVDGDSVTVGEPLAVQVQFTESSESESTQRLRQALRGGSLVRQTSDGRWIGCSILCTATVNKMGILDSRKLFDSFVARFQGDGSEYINLLHLGGEHSRIGVLRHIWREDKLLVGLYEFTQGDPVAEACAGTLATDEEGFWGGSIEFQHYGEPLLVEVADGIKLPTTHDGQLLGYSIARNQDCAAWYTGNLVMERSMTDKDRAIALEMLGDEALVDELASRLGEANRTLAGAITYTTRPAGEEHAGEAKDGDATEAPASADLPLVYELEPEALEQLADQVAQHRTVSGRFEALNQALETRVSVVLERLEALTADLESRAATLNERLARLEQDDQQRYRQYDLEKPKQPVVKFGVRPRDRKPVDTPDVTQESAFARKARERRAK